MSPAAVTADSVAEAGLELCGRTIRCEIAEDDLGVDSTHRIRRGELRSIAGRLVAPSSKVSTATLGSPDAAPPRDPLRRGSSSVCASARVSARATTSMRLFLGQSLNRVHQVRDFHHRQVVIAQDALLDQPFGQLGVDASIFSKA